MQRDVQRPADRAWRSRSLVIFLLLTANFQSFRLALVGRSRRCRRSSRAWSLALLAHAARRSTSSRSWARSWRSAWRWPTPSCWSPSPSAAASRATAARDAAVEGAASRLRPILMTSLRHDRRHGPDGAGLGRRRRADRAARPGGHRRPGRRDAGDARASCPRSSRCSSATTPGSASIHPDDDAAEHSRPGGGSQRATDAIGEENGAPSDPFASVPASH